MVPAMMEPAADSRNADALSDNHGVQMGHVEEYRGLDQTEMEPSAAPIHEKKMMPAPRATYSPAPYPPPSAAEPKADDSGSQQPAFSDHSSGHLAGAIEDSDAQNQLRQEEITRLLWLYVIAAYDTYTGHCLKMTSSHIIQMEKILMIWM